MTDDQLLNLFTYHPPFGDQATRYGLIRMAAHTFAKLVNEACPESREKSLAITAIQQATQWANASIAINETAPAVLATNEAPTVDPSLFIDVDMNVLKRAGDAYSHRARGIKGAEEYERALANLGLPLDRMRGKSLSLRCGTACTPFLEWLPAIAAEPPEAKAEVSPP
jgi:hypothetical protein